MNTKLLSILIVLIFNISSFAADYIHYQDKKDYQQISFGGSIGTSRKKLRKILKQVHGDKNIVFRVTYGEEG